MELGSCMRTDADATGTPSKRVRSSNGFHVPETVECASKAGRRETPVRKRINVDGVFPPPCTHVPYYELWLLCFIRQQRERMGGHERHELIQSMSQ